MKPYFSHDEGARNDPKLIKVLMRLGQAGKGVYWDLVEMLYEQGGYLLLEDCESHAFALRTDCALITKLVYEFDLFLTDETRFWSATCLARMEMRDAKKLARAEAGAKGGKIKAEREAAAKALLELDHSNTSQNPSIARALLPEILAIKEKEIKGKDIVGKPTNADSAAPSSAAVDLKAIKEKEKELDFISFWLGYHDNLPKRGSKSKAKAKWQTLSAATRALIIAGLEAHRADATRNGPDFLPYATTFLSEKRWESETYGQAPPPIYQTPNQVPGNWNTASQGAYTAPMGQGIPHPSSYLKPEFLIN